MGTTAAKVNAATKVNSLDTTLPSSQDNIYPTVDPLRPVDYPQPTRFTNVDQIIVRVASEKDIPLANRQITDLLHQRHHIKMGQPDDFHIRDNRELIRALRDLKKKTK